MLAAAHSSDACGASRSLRTPKETCRSRQILDVSSYGFDPSVCGTSTDPFGGVYQGGLRVPGLASTSTSTRYLFQLATVGIPYERECYLLGLGQMLTIWVDTANTAANQTSPTVLPVAPLEQPVGREDGNAVWRFPDANVSWHLRLLRSKPVQNNQNASNADSFAWRWSDTPACIFETAGFAAANLDGNSHPDNYTALTSYTAPGNGTLPGQSVGALGTFYDLRFAPQGTYFHKPIPVCGPGWLVFYASVAQTNNTTRSTLSLPAAMPLSLEDPEDSAVNSFPSAIYGRVGGRMIVEV